MSIGFELLSIEQMRRADAMAVAQGLSGQGLMEAAGAAVAAAVTERWPPQRAVILCGPGNNGGDGFVAARHLQAAGWTVETVLFGRPEALTGDAAWAAALWEGPIQDAADVEMRACLSGAPLVIDAVFGAGLSRPVDGPVAVWLLAVGAAGGNVVAVDVPSGICGDTGQALGPVAPATLTVTFFRKKPGHLLYPGRRFCGPVCVVDIGINDTVLADIAPCQVENGPSVWAATVPWPDPEDHKYRRGHAVLAGGARMTGATRLAAAAAQRIGAGLVTVVCPPEAFPIYAGASASVLIEPAATTAEMVAAMRPERCTGLLVGPGAGVSAATQRLTVAVLALNKPTVLDADALSCLANASDDVLTHLPACCVLTPHDGEFARLFSFTGDRASRARAAACQSGAVIVLKGADSCIAAPDGRLAINSNAPPFLATAGAGDVLSGLIVGLLAQGMPAFEAACAAVWIHGDAATQFGPGLIADDLPSAVPAVLRRLRP